MNRVLAPRHLKFRPLIAALGVVVLGAAHAGQALPSGLQVAAGQASTQTQGGVLTVTNSANAILNWQSFSIGAQNAVRFVQPDASSQVLNRVTGNDPSAILGSLSSNGRVWLLNPNGVLFGRDARVDVAGLVTSTLNLRNEDWLAGRRVFEAGSATAAAGIVNQGELRASLGGRVALVGGTVRNEGLIEAPGGQVLLAAGHSVELVDTGAPNLAVKIKAPQGGVVNLGQLTAAGGRVDVHGAAVNQQGLVRADSLTLGPGGEIVLQAGERLTLSAGSVTSADAQAGRGGQIKLLGREVGVLDGASVSASGRDGGGEIVAGGGLQGRDPGLPNAHALFFGRGASISADGLERGDGGRIILWSDLSTRAFGSLSAHGGRLGGNGGFIETSGGWLDARPSRVDLAAPAGRPGNWLLDPYNITITDSASDGGYDASFTATANDATISTSVLNGKLDLGVNVTVSTGGAAGGQAGDITLSSAHVLTSSSTPGSLTLIADRDIVMTGSSILANGGPLPVSLLAGRAGAGGIQLTSSDISTSGGAVKLGGFTLAVDTSGSARAAAVGYAGRPAGVSLVRSNISAASGSVEVQGAGGIGGSTGGGVGISIDAGSSIDAASVLLNGSATAGDGLLVYGNLTASRAMELKGRGSGLGVGLYSVQSSGPATGYASVQPGGSLSVTGVSTGSSSGVLIDASRGGLINALSVGGESSPGSGSFSLVGDNVAGGAPTIDIRGNEITNVIEATGASSSAVVKTLGANGSITISNAYLQGFAGPTVFDAGGTLTINDSYVFSLGPISLQAQSIALGGFGGGVTSAASGDAIVASGRGTSPLASFSSGAEFGLSATTGRWIVYADDVTRGGVSLGSPSYDFTRHGSAYLGWAGDTGNGVVYQAVQKAAVRGAVADKTYDGTTAASVGTTTLTGVLGDTGSLASSATFGFADPNAGVGKAVLVASAGTLMLFDSGGKPVYGYQLQSELTGNIMPKVVTARAQAQSKVYDATTAAVVTGSDLSGLIGTQTLTLAGSGDFSDKNVGASKLVAARLQLQDGSNGGLASNYQLAESSFVSTASITPRLVTVTGVTANNKVYDATTAATLAGTARVAALGSDVLSLDASAVTAQFSDRNAGVGKAVSAAGYKLAGADAGNYQLVQPAGLTADIGKATLTYVAQSTTLLGGALPPASFEGTVEGFVGADTLQTATTGSAVFTTPATVPLQIGRHPINGSGLVAANYNFVQAPANAQALVVAAGASSFQQAAQTGNAELITSQQAVTALPAPPSPSSTGLLELASVPPPALPAQPLTGSEAASAFGPQALGEMSSGSLAQLLGARELYKKTQFAPAITQLEKNPRLADLSPCRTLQEAAQGKCLITEELRRARLAEVTVRPGTPPAVTASSAPVTAQQAPATSSLVGAPPAPPPMTPVSTAATVAVTPAFPQFGKRHVRQASLPQIARKVALLIGAGNYRDSRIPSLANAVGDARAVGQVFENKLGYEAVVIEDADRAAVVGALNRLALELGPQDSVVVFYAGHGELVEGKAPGDGHGYWQLVDSQADKPETWLSNADIARLLGQIGARQVALISDSCYSGALASGERLRAVPGARDPDQLLAKRSVVVMSSGGNEPVFDSGKQGHSSFAWNLMKTVEQVASWQPGGNVFERVRFAVARELPQRPQYAAAIGHQPGGDYLFERRQLDTLKP